MFVSLRPVVLVLPPRSGWSPGQLPPLSQQEFAPSQFQDVTAELLEWSPTVAESENLPFTTVVTLKTNTIVTRTNQIKMLANNTQIFKRHPSITERVSMESHCEMWITFLNSIFADKYLFTLTVANLLSARRERLQMSGKSSGLSERKSTLIAAVRTLIWRRKLHQYLIPQKTTLKT